jgi:hypothetical protein
MLRPDLELLVMCGQSFEMLPSLVGHRRIERRRPGKRAVEMVFRHFEE